MDLRELTKGIAEHGKYVSFWGSCLSNFYPCSFELDGKNGTVVNSTLCGERP